MTDDTEAAPDDVTRPLHAVRERLWRIIFRSDTPAGRAFDIALLIVIVLSVVVVMLDSIADVSVVYSRELQVLEWALTALFTMELVVRLWVVRRPSRYLLSFFGVVDLLSVLPSFLGLVLAGSQYLMTVRVLRLLRMFRILKMSQYIGEASLLVSALRASQRKILVFLLGICMLVCVEGTLIYLVEHDNNAAFASIPHAMYWAIVTLTTVGYGDVVPVTVLGKIIASFIMLTGFAIIAVPTGVMTAELGRHMQNDKRACRECGWTGHDTRALYCLHCGVKLSA